MLTSMSGEIVAFTMIGFEATTQVALASIDVECFGGDSRGGPRALG
ncbi:MAG: hypothetical protein ABL921_21145 [Pirellula sp.]